MSQERLHLIISGKVQGVFFRASTEDRATQLGLSGWVMNRADGTVEVVAEGKKEQLDKLRSWCYEGPSRAKVTDVDVSWENYQGEFSKFRIKYRK